MRHKGVSPQTDPGRLGTTEDAWADSMKAFPGYDDRPPPTGLNRGGGSDPLTRNQDVRVALPRDAGVTTYGYSTVQRLHIVEHGSRTFD